MTNFDYNTNIPFATNNPSSDQPKMQVNTNSTANLINVDHVGFQKNNGGYHTNIHEVPQGTWLATPRTGAPVATAGFNQIFSLNSTPDTTGGVSDTQLFAQTGLGGVAQLTGSSVSAKDGYCWSGGFLFQWGVVSGVFGSGTTFGTVTFKDRVPGTIPFPTSCFIVNTTPTYTTAQPSDTGIVAINTTGFTNLEFSWTFNSNSNKYTGFYWFAIGQ